MPITLNDTKRATVAQKLADMRAIQDLILKNERQFLQECSDQDIQSRLRDMIEDDEKNLGIIETTITQYGNPAEPKDKVKKMVSQAQEMMQGSDLTLYEKMAQHELLKHGQVLSGLVVHKAGQVVGSDVQQAIAPLNTVNFENRAHQEQLKGILEYLGTRELTGQEPDDSVWGKIQDALAAMTGAVGSAVTQASDASDLDIVTLIYMDHQKARTLIREIEKSKDPNKAREYFGQLYKDLVVHAKAEEEVIYPQVRSFYGDSDTQELYNEQAELEKVLNEMKASEPATEAFQAMLKRVKERVGDHTRQEESTMFASMWKNMNDEQREQMATEFKEAKKRLQDQMQNS
ncbi:MAG: hemerythrin domain-containing protein [Cyanobacteriota bacterium]|nr:hemerythrin domain-containing protein [Cyanobacteriota bacterium]